MLRDWFMLLWNLRRSIRFTVRNATMNGRNVALILAAILVVTPAFAQMTVISSTPANGAVNVPLTTTVSFTFSEALDTSRHLDEDGFCVYFLCHDPVDSLQGGSITFSPDLHTMNVDVIQTPNTDFAWLATAAFAVNGDTLSMPFPLSYSTAADHGSYHVSGTIHLGGGAPPPGSILGLLTRNPFGEGHADVRAGTVITDPAGTYLVNYVRPGTYYPICARDGNHDGNMDGDADLTGVYDPGHTGQPQPITVTNADLTGIDITLVQMSQWVTARTWLDSAVAIMGRISSDYHLVIVQSSSDTVALDGTSRSWRYGFYSANLQRGMSVDMSARSADIDSVPEDNQFPPDILDLPLDFLNSDTIMAIVEANGGAEIRQQHDVVQRMLAAGNQNWMVPQDPGLMVWVAAYGWQDGQNWQIWTVLIDLHTGQIVVPQSVNPRGVQTAATFGLLPNYPNPFNPETTVPFVLPKSTHVTLTVYDLLGRNVATLVNGDLGQGLHLVRFDGSRLTSGLYLCRLDAGAQSFTRKMLLLK